MSDYTGDIVDNECRCGALISRAESRCGWWPTCIEENECDCGEIVVGGAKSCLNWPKCCDDFKGA